MSRLTRLAKRLRKKKDDEKKKSTTYVDPTEMIWEFEKDGKKK